jgi:hypothetical protein
MSRFPRLGSLSLFVDGFEIRGCGIFVENGISPIEVEMVMVVQKTVQARTAECSTLGGSLRLLDGRQSR